MRTFRFLTALLLPALLFAGCMKEDIDELRRQTAENEARIAALEQWQTTVNSNISALQGLIEAIDMGDYVTGVTQFTTPSPGGYTITFLKSSPITIWNGEQGQTGAAGADGVDGINGTSPVIGVSQDTDGVYYWTLDGEWLTDDGTPSGNKIPVTGRDGADGHDGKTPTVEIGDNGNWIINGNDTGVNATGDDGATPTVEIGNNGNWFINGSDTGVKAAGTDGTNGTDGATPRVAIGTDGNWYISADGTASGTPPGTGWTDTNVKATGEDGAKGDKGDQGDSIFAADGVNNDHEDYMVFTLADNTVITLPKYKSIGISFEQPDGFTAGVAQEITYASTGNVAPTVIRVKDLPTGWKYGVDYAASKITITPPSVITDDNLYGEATVQVGDDNQVALTYWLTVGIGASKNEVGAVYYQKGIPAGIIYIINDGTPGTGRVVSLDEGYTIWSQNTGNTYGASSDTDGLWNLKAIYESSAGKTPNSFDEFPPVEEYLNDKNPAGTLYESGLTDIWYLPAIYELLELFTVWNSDQSTFNGYMTAVGGTAISTNNYWSSTEYLNSHAWHAYFLTGFPYGVDKTNQHRVRAILAF